MKTDRRGRSQGVYGAEIGLSQFQVSELENGRMRRPSGVVLEALRARFKTLPELHASAPSLPHSAPPPTSPDEDVDLLAEWQMLCKVYRGRHEKPHLWVALQQNLKAFSKESPDVEPGKVAPLSPKVVEIRQSSEQTKRKK